ncbi:MAG: ATPase V [Spirochaetes bacterium]|nr:ATPase V [Spirochaetota bacterium]
MIFPQSMIRLSAVILHKSTDAVTRALLNAGVIDFIDIRKTEFSLSGHLTAIDQELGNSDVCDLRNRIEQLLKQANITLPLTSTLDADSLSPVDAKQIVIQIETITAQIRDIRIKQKELQHKLNRKNEILRQTSLFEKIDESPPADSGVKIRTGIILKSRKEGLAKALSVYPAVIHFANATESEFPAVLLYMKRDEERISPVLDRFCWQTIEFPSELSGQKDQIADKLNSEISELKDKQKSLRMSAENIIVNNAPSLRESWKNLTITKHYIKIQDSFGKTTDTVLFTGWIPRNKQRQTEKMIKKATAGNCYLEWSRPEKDSSVLPDAIPVKLNHGSFFKPFQWIVENYSLPQYGSIDPTIIVAISFLAMFGLMFGDAGHGLVLSLAGATIAFANGKKQNTPFMLGRLIFWCGCASIITGILFGSYFGFAFFPPLWFDYHGIVLGHKGSGLISDVYDILGITIRFGIIIIGSGLILNMINRLRSHQYLGFLFDKGGILGSWFYAGGVYTAFFFVNSNYKSFPPAHLIAIAIGIPTLLFALKPSLEFFFEKRKEHDFKPALLLDWFMDWIVELLELFSGYLSNTLSFMRIAGLGIAHVSLMSAFFQIAATIESGFISLVILILGNILVIVLEGLSAGIQSLRLNYYEFFSKYFRGSGKVYQPVSLRRK